MRRPSIPFEAIGLHARLRGQPLCVTPGPMRTETMSNNPDPRDPTQLPPGDLSDNVGKTPGDFIEDNEEEGDEDLESEDMDDEDDEGGDFE